VRRLVFPVILLFWLAMNVLLWRAKYGDTDRDSRVSKDVVFNKIFNAPDASNLRVSQNGMLLGCKGLKRCWRARLDSPR
jgi:hypothetical protein